MSRRQWLALAGAGALIASTGFRQLTVPITQSSGHITAKITNQLIVDATTLIVGYQQLVDQDKQSSALANKLADQHRQHIQRISGSGNKHTQTDNLPATPSTTAALTRLIQLEIKAGQAATGQALAASSTSDSALISSIAACRFGHAAMLQRLLTKPPSLPDFSQLPDVNTREILSQATVNTCIEILKAEHATIYGYQAIGAWTKSADQTFIHLSDQSHQQRRDYLSTLLKDKTAQSLVAQTGYVLPHQITGWKDAAALAQTLEDHNTPLWLALTTTNSKQLRSVAINALTDCVIRKYHWQQRLAPAAAAVSAFPGYKE